MKSLEIRLYPDPILRKRCEPVEELTPEIKELVLAMLATMMDKKIAENGITLYTELEKRIKSSSVSYTDETGWPINGEP